MYKVFGILESDVDVVIETEKFIYLNTYNSTEDILNIFGDLIQNLHLNFADIEMDVIQKFVEIINEKSFASARKLELIFCKENVLEGFKNPFKGVTSLTFSSNLIGKFDGKGRKLNELFPNVQEFYVRHTKASDWATIDGHFPNLRWFEASLPIAKKQNDVDETHISSFLKKNSRIDNFSIENADFKILKATNEVLPKLTTLKIDQFSRNNQNDEGKGIHFQNVKKLTIKSGNEEKMPEDISFEQLEELKLYIEPEFSDKSIEFIKKLGIERLKTFTLYTRVLTKDTFLKVPKILPNLEFTHISMVNRITLTANDVLDFIDKSQQLKELTVNLQMQDNEKNKLKKALENQYNVEFDSKPEFKAKIVKKI